ncbi:MAG: hydantoinase/oxoprolinase family protein [Actinobacteria bacterium]|nr:hydantoinase/oxoprolinase family protein [Actinomycetota bacterium]MBU1944850.1 hydantoinase/oxoprolinase family protein [Actinomycetota bacterium]MBU2687083.1 hydantoinase/oxoprolinase family protein [Actinomycetota bacterium]
MSSRHAPRILAIDAGGTMTDTFVIDEKGAFVVGKAQTTPDDEAQGFLSSSRDALSYWDTTVEEAFPSLVTGIYSGTSMLNRLLERKGRKVGVIVSKGMEDYFRLERGVQSYLGYSYSDRLHVCTHQHNEPLVPRHLVRGVPERIDVFGDAAIPLDEEAAARAVEELLDLGVEAICVNFLFSYRNPAHELQMKDIAEEVLERKGSEVPVTISSDHYSVRGDFPRLNTLTVEAFAAEPSRVHLRSIDSMVKEHGAHFDLRIMASHGGTISIESRELARTLVSGPIGGVIGAKWLCDHIGVENVFCTDIGGTSFDLAIITGGEYDVKTYPDMARTLFAIPLVEMDSVGEGTGSFVRINPTSCRIEIGPDSAGYRIGTSWPQGNIDTVTINDCDVVLGLINPDYFLGGDITLDREEALKSVQDQVAAPLGIDVYRAASGVVELFEDGLKNNVLSRIMGKGYAPVNYTLLSYGGGGPLHVGGIAEGMGFERVLVPAWAAGFSAFGCSCSEFEYRFNASLDLPVAPDISQDEKEGLVEMVNGQCAFLREKIVEEFSKSGVDEGEIVFRIFVRMQYMGQLRDLEVRTGFEWLDGPESLDEVIRDFEDLYAKVYALSARSPELGHLITQVVLSGTVEVEKPALPLEELYGDGPPTDASKGQRDVYWRGDWLKAGIWEMDRLKPGNRIAGLSIVESPATTLVIPPGWSAYLDEHWIFHLEPGKGV